MGWGVQDETRAKLLKWKTYYLFSKHSAGELERHTRHKICRHLDPGLLSLL